MVIFLNEKAFKFERRVANIGHGDVKQVFFHSFRLDYSSHLVENVKFWIYTQILQ